MKKDKSSQFTIEEIYNDFIYELDKETITKEDNYEEVIKKKQEEVKKDPENKEAQNLLGFHHYLNNEAGKAVNIYKKLVEKHSEDEDILGNAAVSNAKRGFNRKAESYFEKAYELGNRKTNFLLNYADFCLNEGNGDKHYELMLNACNTAEKAEILDVILFKLLNDYKTKEDILEAIEKIIQTRTELAKKCENFFITLLVEYISSYSNNIVSYEDLTKVIELVETLGIHNAQIDKVYSFGKLLIEERAIRNDNRIGDILRHLIALNLLYNGKKYNGEEFKSTKDEVISTFLNTQLDVIYMQKELEEQIAILREDYTHTVSSMKEFFDDLEKLKGTNTLWEKYKKIYLRHNELPEDTELFVNQTVTVDYKVGRNDPCPCGSNKKHKKCCGR